jgi:tetratricopeptide (TPR) repeat protein
MRKMVALLIIGFLTFPSLSYGISEEVSQSLATKLDRWEAEEAWSDVRALLATDAKDPDLLELASHIAFHRGDYQEALRLIKSSNELVGDDEKKKAFALFVEQTQGVTGSLKRIESTHFIISLDEKQDGILADYVTDALEMTFRTMADKYGFRPKEKIRVEVFPDSKGFYYASTLSARDIEMGAVGLAQFNKLMMLSPRALVHGYRWLDAVSHEYMHYLILRLTSNKAPIWFHEGLAKFEETEWRRGPTYLSALYQSLLGKALAEKKLIPFEKMEPSVVKLETPEEVQLAYAQAASAIEFVIARSGHEGLREIMKRMATSQERGASESIKDVLGLKFEEFETHWKEFLAAKEFKEIGGATARRYKIKEGKTDEDRLEMEEIKSLVSRNRAHLGDLLKERGRTGAAVSEYRRALDGAPDSVPILTRLSSVLKDLDRNDEALDILKKARAFSPDHPTIYTSLGQIYLKAGNSKEARDAFQESLQINPFNPDVHQGLARAYEMLGEKSEALKEKEIAKKLTQ